MHHVDCFRIQINRLPAPLQYKRLIESVQLKHTVCAVGMRRPEECCRNTGENRALQGRCIASTTHKLPQAEANVSFNLP